MQLKVGYFGVHRDISECLSILSAHHHNIRSIVFFLWTYSFWKGDPVSAFLLFASSCFFISLFSFFLLLLILALFSPSSTSLVHSFRMCPTSPQPKHLDRRPCTKMFSFSSPMNNDSSQAFGLPTCPARIYFRLLLIT